MNQVHVHTHVPEGTAKEILVNHGRESREFRELQEYCDGCRDCKQNLTVAVQEHQLELQNTGAMSHDSRMS